MKSRPGQGLTEISKKIRHKQNDRASRRTQCYPHTRREQHPVHTRREQHPVHTRREQHPVHTRREQNRQKPPTRKADRA